MGRGEKKTWTQVMTGGFNSRVPGRFYYTWQSFCHTDCQKDGEHWKGIGMIDFFMLEDKKVVKKAACISTTVDE